MEKRLYRAKDDRMLFGLLGGIARYLDVDPAIVRVAFILVCLVQPVFIIGYFLMALVVPEEKSDENRGEMEEQSKAGGMRERRTSSYESDARTRALFGAIIIGAGIYIVTEKYVHFSFGLRELTGILLVALGIYVVWRR